jgi:hypothetical protein
MSESWVPKYKRGQEFFWEALDGTYGLVITKPLSDELYDVVLGHPRYGVVYRRFTEQFLDGLQTKKKGGR